MGDDQSQVWQPMTFGGKSSASVNTLYQGQLAPEVSEYRAASAASESSIHVLLNTLPAEPTPKVTLSYPAWLVETQASPT